MINKISFKNYKSFKENQELDLKPITILIGKNSSGKSAVTKLPTLISGSLKGDFSPPLKWENSGVKLGLSYGDLIYNKNFVTSNLELTLENESEKLFVIIKGDEKNKTEFIEYSLNDKTFELNETKFKGFINDKVEIKNLKIDYDYIGPFRKLPQPNYPNNFNDYKKVGVEGENAYQILIQAYEGRSSLLTKVSEWYKENFEGWKLDVVPIVGSPPSYQVVVSNNEINNINIINVGQGMNQALPLIVRSFMHDEEDSLIIIEEPETHLHPAAHGNLAERFVDSFIEENKKRYLIETHSQNFVLRIRKLVAQGKLKTEDLAIYFVDFNKDKSESTIRPIVVESDGEVKWWPENIFNESLKEVIGIRKAQEL
jgi:predicted ATPase